MSGLKSESLFPGSGSSGSSYSISTRAVPGTRKLSAGRGGAGLLHRPASLFIQSNSSLNTQDSLMSSSYGLSGRANRNPYGSGYNRTFL